MDGLILVIILLIALLALGIAIYILATLPKAQVGATGPTGPTGGVSALGSWSIVAQAGVTGSTGQIGSTDGVLMFYHGTNPVMMLQDLTSVGPTGPTGGGPLYAMQVFTGNGNYFFVDDGSADFPNGVEAGIAGPSLPTTPTPLLAFMSSSGTTPPT